MNVNPVATREVVVQTGGYGEHRCTTVTIDSHNTPGLTARLGKTGDGRSLGVDGQATVIWNGKQAYTVSAKTIELGKK